MISVEETVVFYSDLSDINLVVVFCTFSVVNYKIRTALPIDDNDAYSYTFYILWRKHTVKYKLYLCLNVGHQSV